MSVLSRDDFFNNLKAHLGEDTSDENLQFLEDVTDTFNDLENRAKGDGKDWKAEATRIDAEWRERYRARFFSGKTEEDDNLDDNEDDKSKKLTFENLFKEG